jgi:hypothetical protein
MKGQSTGKKLHNEGLHNAHCSSNIGMITMRCTRHVARMQEMRNAYKMLVGKPEGRKPLEDLGVDGKIILNWILGK